LNWRLHRVRVHAKEATATGEPEVEAGPAGQTAADPVPAAIDIVSGDGAPVGWLGSAARETRESLLALAYLHRRADRQDLRLASGEPISALGTADGPGFEKT